MKRWKKVAIGVGCAVLLGCVGVGVLYAVDDDPDVGEYRDVVSGYDPLAEEGAGNIAEERGIIPAHALAIANIVSEEPLGEEFAEFTDYFICDVREGGYYIIEKQIPNAIILDGAIPKIVIDNNTGAIIQIGVIR